MEMMKWLLLIYVVNMVSYLILIGKKQIIITF